MTPAPGHPRDIFRSTAPYYARYRPPYPEAFIKHLATRFGLDGTQRLLDLGCGPGDLALPLAAYAREVVAMDPELEMLRQAIARGQDLEIENVRFVEGGSNELARLSSELGRFHLVVMGESFHWMDRDATLATLYETVEPGGGIAITWKHMMAGVVESWSPDVRAEDGPSAPNEGARDWLSVANRVVRRWLGEERRAGSGFYQAARDHHEAYVARSRFRRMEVVAGDRFSYRRQRDIDGVLGWMYSTSYASPYVLGELQEAFEADLRRSLLDVEPSGVFEETVSIGSILAWKDPK